MPQATYNVDPSACYCTGLKRASRRVSLFYDRCLAPSGLTSGQLAIVATIAEWPGGQSPPLGELARALAMDRAALTHTLKPLVREGLVEFGRHARDLRARLVQLTPQGNQRLRKAQPLWTAAQRSFAKSFGENQAIALRALLTNVAETAVDDW